jgi:hypothetical protein
VQRDATLCKRERLIMTMTHQRHVRLVVDDAGEHVVGGNRHRETFTLPQTCRRFVNAAGLREEDRGQRVHEREVSSIACGVERRSGFCQVVANNARITDLLVAQRELVVRQANRSRVVRELGMLQRA